MKLPPHIEKQIEAAAKNDVEQWKKSFAEGFWPVHRLTDQVLYDEPLIDLFKRGATTMAPALIEYGMALGIQKAMEFLSDNAGNYCCCQYTNPDRPPYLFCDKHAQMLSYGYLEEQFAPELSSLSPTGEEK